MAVYTITITNDLLETETNHYDSQCFQSEIASYDSFECELTISPALKEVCSNCGEYLDPEGTLGTMPAAFMNRRMRDLAWQLGLNEVGYAIKGERITSLDLTAVATVFNSTEDIGRRNYIRPLLVYVVENAK